MKLICNSSIIENLKDLQKPINMNTLIQTEKTFSAFHFVQTAPENSPCRNGHGHDFRCIVEIIGYVRKDGMIIDFREIKETISELDHKMLLPDFNLHNNITIIEDGYGYEVFHNNKKYFFPHEDVFMLNGIDVITSENIAKYFYHNFIGKYPNYKFKIRIYEGNSSYAEVSS